MLRNNKPFSSISAIIVGNAIEWYDFTIYSFLTIYISLNFFPQGPHSLLVATATVGVAFIARPIGGLSMGYLSDKYSRARILQAMLWLMVLAISLIIITPPYSVIGWYAPILIVLARLLQGFSAG